MHRIATVSYRHGGVGNDAPLSCFCGWAGKAGEFAEHRRDSGAARPEGSSAVGPVLGTAKSWRLKK